MRWFKAMYIKTDSLKPDLQSAALNKLKDHFTS